MSSNSSDTSSINAMLLATTSAPSSSTSSSSSSNLNQLFKIDASVKPDRPTSPKAATIPTSLSEWQLMAVLHRANLVQYYDTFIAQGGDDINQIMQCDEHEFLEIMSLVGMLTKPLHVRRLQRALTEYSKDQAGFHLTAMQQIGPPPVSPYPFNNSDQMALLFPTMSLALNTLSSSSDVVTPEASGSPSTLPSHSAPSATTNNSVALASDVSTPTDRMVSTHGSRALQPQPHRATANIVSGHHIGHHFGAPHTHTPTSQQQLHQSDARRHGTASGEEKEGTTGGFVAPTQQQQQPTPSLINDFVLLGDHDPNQPSSESPVLSAQQISRLAECARIASQNLPQLMPRFVQNKKRISKEVLDLLSSSPNCPNRAQLFRKFSAIYGRFDAKRKPHKVLSLHETAVNEAAAQVCLLVPALLTRRDELFPLARQIVKEAGYQYAKSRKRPCDPVDLHSPFSSAGVSPVSSPAPTDDGDVIQERDEKRVREEIFNELPESPAERPSTSSTFIDKLAHNLMQQQQRGKFFDDQN